MARERGKQIHEQDRDWLAAAIESVLLVAGGPVSLTALASACGARKDEVNRLLHELLRRRTGGLRIQVQGEHVQLVTAPEYSEVVQKFLGTAKPPPLSRAALETLTAVAYGQPITRAEIEAARGVNSDRALQTLLARGLVEERGLRAGIGRPREYGTAFAFLEYYGLTSLDDLPPLPEEPFPSLAPQQIGMRSNRSDSPE